MSRTEIKARVELAEAVNLLKIQLLGSYNAGSLNIEELFNQLVELSRTLSVEQQRELLPVSKTPDYVL